MSCFAVSKFTGKCGGGGNNNNNSPTNPTDDDEAEDDRHKLLRSAAHNVSRAPPGSTAPTPSKKKSKNIPNIEIVQEMPTVPPPSPRPFCPGSPAPPGTPLIHSRRLDCSSVCSMQPPPSPHLGYHHFNNSSNNYHMVAPQYNVRNSHCYNSSVPPSPSISAGCRSPVLQRKSNYSTFEVQNAALSSLKEEVIELSVRLSHVTKERDHLEKSLNRMQLDKLRLSKQKDDQMDSMSSRYEERLVELHSVIAELSRQVEEKSREKIAEEETDEENDDTERNRPKDDDVNGQASRSEMGSRTSTDIDAQAVEAGNRLAAQLGIGVNGATDLCAFLRMTRSTASRSMGGGGVDHLSSTNSLQMMALQEELSDAKERNIQLTARLQQREADLEDARRDLENLAQEKERLREKVTQLEEQNLLSPALSPTKLNIDLTPGDDNVVPKSPSLRSPGQPSSYQPQSGPLPKLRMAEKKRIKRINVDDDEDGQHPQVTGSDLLSVGVRSSFLVEHLVQDIQDKSSMHEFTQSFISPSSPLMQSRGAAGPGGQAGGQHKRRSAFLESKLKEFEIEMERLSSRIEHLKSQNEVLTLTLSESKNHCDNITVLIGKYESNYTAQQLAVTYANHIIESLEVLVALLETELGLVLANNRNGVNINCDEQTKCIDQASDNRRAAESMAKRLLTRLEMITRPDSGLAMPSGSSIGCSGSGGITGGGTGAAWEDSSGYSQATSSASPSLGSNGVGAGNCELTTSSIGSFIFNPHCQTQHHHHHHQQQQPKEPDISLDVARSDEIRLRDYIAYLKATRSSIQSTVVSDLESVHSISEVDQSPKKQITINELRTADLEMAVLVQELMAMREERADLRAQVYLMEQEKKSLELLINSQKAQEMALKTHIKHLQEELENQESQDDLDSEASFHNRNSELKTRITELLTTLEKVKRNSELRQQQSDELIKDLKSNQRSLSEKLEKTKSKYEQRLKRMEQQILQSMLFPSQFGAAVASETGNGTICSNGDQDEDDSEDESEFDDYNERKLMSNNHLRSVMSSRGEIIKTLAE